MSRLTNGCHISGDEKIKNGDVNGFCPYAVGKNAHVIGFCPHAVGKNAHVIGFCPYAAGKNALVTGLCLHVIEKKLCRRYNAAGHQQ